MTRATRRDFLRTGAAGGVALFTFTIAGCEKKMTPAAAKAAGADYHTLSESEVATLDALGELLLAGSAKNGLAHFIDTQLSGDPADSMLMIKYLRVPAPFTEFYRAGLHGAQAASQAEFGKEIASLSPEQGASLITKMAAGTLAEWSGPPAPFFFFVLRNDAVDVTYGTMEGFEHLGVPYMPHIAPPTPWGA